MFLRSLVIKGFKSFADPVTIDLSPGVSVIVGPNGSGKSNIVDAIAWVLGAQGPKTVRSSKMDEVIFSGAGKRGPLGRAEVSIVIDNTDQKLVLDLSEITITRTLFRSGESEYSLNGNSCRLIDLQELLSDAGVGKQQHVIISQGQLDLILNARPEERRGAIEEAAGITKFKKRRERTERRLESLEGDVNRAGDLVKEVRRQIRPLAQQAQKAKRQLEIRDRITLLKRYLAGSEYRALESTAVMISTELVDAEVSLFEVQAEMERINEQISSLESDGVEILGEDLVDLISAADALSERFRAIHGLARQKSNTIVEKLGSAENRQVIDSLTRELDEIAIELDGLEQEIVQLSPDLEQLQNEEVTFTDSETPEIAEKLQRLKQRSIELTNLERSLSAERNTLSGSLQRTKSQIEVITQRNNRLVDQVDAKSEELLRLNDRLTSIIGNLKDSEIALQQAQENELRQKEVTESVKERAKELGLKVNSLSARVTAYEAAIEEGRAKTQAAALKNLRGCLGALVDLIEIESGYEAAFSASVQWLSNSVLTQDVGVAILGLRFLKQNNLEGSLISIGDFRASREINSPTPDRSIGLMRSIVSSADPLLASFLDEVLSGVFIVEDSLDLAIRHFEMYPNLTFVTKEGERLGPDGLWTSSKPMKATGIALEKSINELRVAQSELSQVLKMESDAEALYHELQTKLVNAKRQFDLTREEQMRIESLPAIISNDIENIKNDIERSAQEIIHLLEQQSKVELEHSKVETELAAKEQLIAQTQNEISVLEIKMQEQYRRRRELDSRRSDLELKAATLEQKRLGLERSKGSLKTRLDSEVKLRQEMQGELLHWRREHAGLKYIEEQSEMFSTASSEIAFELKNERSRALKNSQRRLERLNQVRERRLRCEKDIEVKRESVQLCKIRKSETRVRIETMGERIRRDLGIETEIAVNTPIPEGINPTSAERVLDELVRELSGLGGINELAEIELAELNERAIFLETQLDDVKKSRSELVKIIRAIDDEMLQVFEQAFHDVSENFGALFESLFPGGSGRIVLDDSVSPLDSGLEIEVALPGKSVKRLSLLSGGERSLVALAFLFAIFESRPSPFYILDEVEAALDDVNLNRFLRLIKSFGERSQLLVISHQKRTMEIADYLYGVTMQEGGSTKVVSQKMGKIIAIAQ